MTGGRKLPKDLTVEILKDIRTEVRATNMRLEGTNSRLDTLTERVETITECVDTLTERVDTVAVRMDIFHDGQVRTATELLGVASALREVSALFREESLLRTRVEDHEERLVALERRAC